MILKEKLLKTGYFIDNEYLDDYINLVVTPPNTNSLDYTEIHHILQKQYFKIINKPVDNSLENKVNLLYRDHCKAHYLLYFCTVGKLKIANARAVNKMFSVITKTNVISKNFRNSIIELSEKDYIKIQECANKIYNDGNSEFYTKAELEILKNNYSAVPFKDLKKLLPNRSTKSIRSKANKEFHLVAFSIWSEDEIAILKQYYSEEGRAIMSRLPKRTWKTITTQANYLGLHTKNYWSDEDIKILIEFYPKEKGKIIKRFKNRTIDNIYSKVKELKQKGLL